MDRKSREKENGLCAGFLARHSAEARQGSGSASPDRLRRGHRAGQPRYRQGPGHVLSVLSVADEVRHPSWRWWRRSGAARSKALGGADPAVLGMVPATPARLAGSWTKWRTRSASCCSSTYGCKGVRGGVPVHQIASDAVLPPWGGEEGTGGDHPKEGQEWSHTKRLLRPQPQHAVSYAALRSRTSTCLLFVPLFP